MTTTSRPSRTARCPPPIRASCETLEDLWTASASGSVGRTARRARCACGLPRRDQATDLKGHVFTIVVQEFADAYTMDLDALRKCCVGELLPDGRVIPFCAYNSLGYREAVRSALAAGAWQ